MYYGSTKLATDWEVSNWKTKLLYTLLFFIPRASKDNEKYYHLINSWLLEIDDQGSPVREIGLDSEKVFKQVEIDTIDKEKFEEAWKSLRRLGWVSVA